MIHGISRREFFGVSALAVVAARQDSEPIIDIHQHTDYSGRTDEQVLDDLAGAIADWRGALR